MDLTLKYNNETGLLDECNIIPEASENPDTLHRYSAELRIANPAYAFNRTVQNGELNDMSDEDYERCIKAVKHISEKIFGKKKDKNIFAVCAGLLRECLNKPACPSAGHRGFENGRISVEDFLDINNMHEELRGFFYSFIGLKLLGHRKKEDVAKVNLDTHPFTCYVPKNNQVFFIYHNGDRKAYVITTYNPLYPFVMRDDSDPDEMCSDYDVEMFLQDNYPFLNEEEIEFVEDTLILQNRTSGAQLLDILKDKDVELIVFKQEPGKEYLESFGRIAPVSNHSEDGTDFIVFRRLKEATVSVE